MPSSTLRIDPLSPVLGAEVSGVNLAQPLEGGTLAELKAAWAKHLVLFFRDQELTFEQHKALGQQFGALHIHPAAPKNAEHPEILVVHGDDKVTFVAGELWHSDVSCDVEPPMGSILRIEQVPSSGGDTLFANMALAYETLSDPMKEFLSGLRAMHDGALPYVGAYGSKPPEGGYPRSEHPVVIRHPNSGAKILYVNSGFTSHIADLSRRESRALLEMLYRHIAETPRLHCRVQWLPNTLTLWDNRCTQHHAVWDYYPHSRRGERVSVVGGKRFSVFRKIEIYFQ